jgi:hypothetical protein
MNIPGFIMYVTQVPGTLKYIGVFIMAKRDTLWTCVGITKHVSPDGSRVVEKVRCGVDLARRIKSSQSKSYVKSQGVKLIEKRTDFVTLPQPMLRLDALKFALASSEFQNPSDQALIQEQIDSRTPKVRKPRSVKPGMVRAKKSEITLDSIKSRSRQDVTAADVLNAVTE